MMVTRLLHKIIFNRISNAPLIIFRVLFGVMMAGSILRFAWNGWINEFYIQPKFHFTYWGFEWVKTLPATGMYVVFAVMFLSSVGILLGFFYRLSASVFFLTFTYVELLDKTYYLNHYYFISLASFLLIWLPAHKRFSWDVNRNPLLAAQTTQALNINILRLQVAIVYVYAGMAKLNRDWLFKAMPLKIWLPANSHLPVLGYFLKQTWVAYLFSWFGALYDLTVPFLFFLSRFRGMAFLTVIIFHVLTWVLFPIGVFPFVMIFSALLFFPADVQEKWLSSIESWFSVRYASESMVKAVSAGFRWKIGLLTCFVAFQLLLPWRYTLYPGDLFWNEEGYRFSWRVMLMEKAGYVVFKVSDPQTNKSMLVNNRDYLTPQQEKMMSTQPDMILQFSHYLKEQFSQQINNPVITADAFVTLNGNLNRRFISPEINLANQELSLAHRDWVIEYED